MINAPAFDFSRCALPVACQRRVFWSTQPDAGDPIVDACGNVCGAPGLKFVDVDGGRTIATDNYVVGVAYNIMLTDGRRDTTECGWSPGTLGGHWCEGYMNGGAGGRIGSKTRINAYAGSVEDQTRVAIAYAQADLQKLVTYGLAVRVAVSGKYVGYGTVEILGIIYGPDGEIGRVGLSGQPISNAWAWSR